MWSANHGRSDGEESDETRCPFRKLIDVSEHFLSKSEEHYDLSWPVDGPAIEIYCPILLLGSDLYEVQAAKKTAPKKTGHILYQLELETKQQELIYHFDVITEKSLAAYLRMIEKEFAYLNKQIDAKLPAILRELDRQNQWRKEAIEKRLIEASVRSFLDNGLVSGT